MSTSQQLQKLAWLGLILIVWILGCDDSAKKPPPEIDHLATQSRQTSEAKRAPRSLLAFQEDLTAGQVGSTQGQVTFVGTQPSPSEIPVTLDRHICGEQPKRKENLLISEHGGIQNTVVSLLRVPKGLPARVSEQSLQLDQRECVFIPHILIVPVNTEFDVLNQQFSFWTCRVIVSTRACLNSGSQVHFLSLLGHNSFDFVRIYP
jgi:hypothetical protein